MRKNILISGVVVAAALSIVAVSISMKNNVFDLNHQMNKMNSTESRKLSDAVVLYWTGGTAYSLNDSDGFGLIHGDIRRIEFDPRDNNFVIVEFIPFKQADQEKELFEFAKVNLKNAKVTELSSSQINEISLELKDVGNFLKKGI